MNYEMWLKNNGYMAKGELGEQVLELLEALESFQLNEVDRKKVIGLFIKLALDE